MEIRNLKNTQPTFESLVDILFGDQISNVFDNTKVNIKENDSGYFLELVLAGYKKDEVIIGVDNDILTISSDVDRVSDSGNYHRFEYHKKSFKRAFRIPEDGDVDNITAKHDNGILSIQIPKKIKTSRDSKKIIIQ